MKEDDKAKETLLGCAAALVTTPSVIVIGFGTMLMRSWVLSKLWAWFAVQQFGMPSVSFLQIAGLFMIWALVYPANVNEEDKGFPWKSFIGSIIIPPICLLEGWIIYKFMGN